MFASVACFPSGCWDFTWVLSFDKMQRVEGFLLIMCFHASFKVFKVRFICLCPWGRGEWGQRATLFFPSSMWVLGTELRSSGLVAIVVTMRDFSHLTCLILWEEQECGRESMPGHRKLVYMHVWTTLKHRFLQVNDFSPRLFNLWFQTCHHLPASVSYVLEKQACTTRPVSSFTFYFFILFF